MEKVLKRLQLQVLLISCIIYGGVKAAPYSKYGRTCRDIGCLPREVCTMAYDTCSFNQQEGTNCGRYPTCVKADKTQQPAPPVNTGPLNPSPQPSSTPYNNIWNLPTTTPRTTTTTTTTRPTTTTTTTRRAWTTKSPFYNPANPSYGGGGSYYGGGGGSDSSFFGSFTTKATTRRPSSPSSSGDSFGSFLSGISGFLSSDGGKLLKGLFSGGGGSSNSGMSTSTRGGGGGSSNSGGFGSFFSDFGDTRSSSRGSLFSENPSGRSNNDASAYPVTRYGEAAPPSSGSSSSSPSHGNYGWKLS